MQEQIQKFIIDLVQERWEKTQKALLLSDLGFALKKTFGDARDVVPRGIKEYLREWPIVQKIEYPGISEKIGLIPNEVSIPDDVTSLFFTKTGREPVEKRPIYKNEFWRAFITPIEDRRYIIIDADETFIVSSEKIANDLNQAYEIKKSDLPSFPEGTSIPLKAEETYKSIAAWIARNNLGAEIFLKHSRPSIKRSAENRLLSLSEVFGDLSIEDQARINIPLDILLKLLSKK